MFILEIPQCDFNHANGAINQLLARHHNSFGLLATQHGIGNLGSIPHQHHENVVLEGLYRFANSA